MPGQKAKPAIVADQVAGELEELAAHPGFHVRLEVGEEGIEGRGGGGCHVGGAGGGVGGGVGERVFFEERDGLG
eukprot:COSAG06_NODE_505_length_14944_cov_17.290901_7_plen_74_part_00